MDKMILNWMIAISYISMMLVWLRYDEKRGRGHLLVMLGVSAIIALPFIMPHSLPINLFKTAMLGFPVVFGFSLWHHVRSARRVHTEAMERQESLERIRQQELRRQRQQQQWDTQEKERKEKKRRKNNDMAQRKRIQEKPAKAASMESMTEIINDIRKIVEEEPWGKWQQTDKSANKLVKPVLSKKPPKIDFDDKRIAKLYAMYHAKLVQIEEQGSDLAHKAQAFLSPMFVTVRSFPELKRSIFKTIHHDSGDPVFTPSERERLMQEIKPLIDMMKTQPS